MDTVSLIIIQYGPPELLRSLFQSLDGHEDEDIISESVIINNDIKIPERTKQEIREIAPSVEKKFIKNDKNSYSSGVNKGFEEATGDFLIISNNDIEWLMESTIQPILEDIKKEEIGICAPQLVNPDGSNQTTSMPFHTIKSELHNLIFYREMHNKFVGFLGEECKRGYESTDGFLIGAFMVTTREMFEKVDGFDERFEFYGEDVDYCYRVKNAGYDIGVNTESKVIHLGGATSSSENVEYYTNQLFRSRLKFINKYNKKLYSKVYLYIKLISTFERFILCFVLYLLLGNKEWKEGKISAKIRLDSLLGVREEL